MKRFSGIWQEGATKHRTFLSVVDSTRQGSKLRRVNIGSFASEADRPKDDPNPFIDALYSYLAAGMAPERAIATAEAEHPPSRMPLPQLLASQALANFEDDSEIIRAIERLIRLEKNATCISVTRVGEN